MKIQFLNFEMITPKLEKDIEQLFSELSSSEQISVKDLLNSENHPYIVLCFENDTLAGMATMATYQVISGKKAWIEDVIVSEKFRQKGIGEKLMIALLEKAQQLEIQSVLLFSNPTRQAAHRLYKRLGFTEKGSTLFIKKANNS